LQFPGIAFFFDDSCFCPQCLGKKRVHQKQQNYHRYNRSYLHIRTSCSKYLKKN
jgi:hypothetical protein